MIDKKELQIQELSRLISKEPNNYKHYYERGILYGGAAIGFQLGYCGDDGLALKDFDKVIELQPNFANAYYHKACIYSLELDIDYDEVEYNLKKALELEPNNADFIKTSAEFFSIHDDVYRDGNGNAADLIEKLLVQDYSAENCLLSGKYLLKHANLDFFIHCDAQRLLETYQKAMERLQYAVEKNNAYLKDAMDMWSEFVDECDYEHESIKNGSSLLLAQVSV